MKKLKVGKKIFMCFSIVIALTLILGGTSLVFLLNIDRSYTNAYNDNAVPVPIVSNVITGVYDLRVRIRTLPLLDMGTPELATALTEMEGLTKNIDNFMALVEQQNLGGDAKVHYDEAKNIYTTQCLPLVQQLIAACQAGSEAGADAPWPALRDPTTRLFWYWKRLWSIWWLSGSKTVPTTPPLPIGLS